MAEGEFTMRRHDRPKAPAKAVLHLTHENLDEMLTTLDTALATAAQSTHLAGSPPLQSAHQILKKTVATTKVARDELNDSRRKLDELEKELLKHQGSVLKAANGYRSQVDADAKGDEAMIASLGLQVAAKGSRAHAPPETPEGIVARPGKAPGEVALTWQKLKHTKSVIVETSPDPYSEETWRYHASASPRRAVIGGLPSGVKRWVRVRACNSAGDSAPSVAVAVQTL
jgi:hypothetical protein